MAIKSRMPASGAIEKAIEALNDGLDISGAGTEVQLPQLTKQIKILERIGKTLIQKV
jgi:hypothetical protein